MSRPHPALQTGYSLDLEIFHETKFHIQQQQFSGELFTVNDEPVTVRPTEARLQALLKKMAPSLVGKGSETVHDESVRKSYEILFDNFTDTVSSSEERDNDVTEDNEDKPQVAMTPEFLLFLEQKLAEMSKNMRNGFELKLIPYKVIIYTSGCHFDEHIDSDHHANMVMTLSVEVALDLESDGGRLKLQTGSKPSKYRGYGSGSDNEPTYLEVPEIEKPNDLSLVLFYSDVRHSVTEVYEGYRLSIVCDVVQTETPVHGLIPPTDVDKLIDFIETAKAKGADAMCIPTSHLYISEDYRSIKPTQLKGRDSLVAYLLTQYLSIRTLLPNSVSCTSSLHNRRCSCYDSPVFELISLVYNGNSEIYIRKEVFDVYQLDGTFSAVYNSDQDVDDDGEELGPSTKTVADVTLTTKKNAISTFKAVVDTEGTFRAISSEYLLGATAFVVAGDGSFRQTHVPSDEIYTGNKGFYGNIYSNLAFLVRLK